MRKFLPNSQKALCEEITQKIEENTDFVSHKKYKFFLFQFFCGISRKWDFRGILLGKNILHTTHSFKGFL